MADEVTKLQAWYSAQCDGEWEHAHGVKIDTLDNPGWSVVVDLGNTVLAAAPFAEQRESDGERDWLHVAVRNGHFEGHGGPESLSRILRVFLEWTQAQQGGA